MQDMNLSKLHREELIGLCETLKTKSPEDAVGINSIIQFIRDQKYGLSFEKHREQVDSELLTKIPIFVEDEDKKISLLSSDSGPAPYNFLLEGDNLHSLKLLEKTHKGAIDVIYIDPPYNTGNKDFTYNDKTVGVDDGYRHSKWLSFMKERLEIARTVLSDKGIVFISIDDNELYQLKLLCDEVFDEINFVSNIIWYKNNSKGNVKSISNVTEYVLCYAKDVAKLPLFRCKKPNAEEMCRVAKKIFDNAGGDVAVANAELRKWIKSHDIKGGEKKYNKIDENGRLYTDKPLTAPGSKLFYDILHPVTKKPCKVASRGWAYKEESLKELLASGHILFGKDETTCPYLKYFLDENLLEVPTSHIQLTANNAIDLQNMGFPKEDFSYPKPLTLIKTLLTFLDTKNATVLDFFAGSGTTGHAVLELNKEDGGNRRFILCTNDENNICEKVTYQRMKIAITGICADGSKYSDGIPANLKYFKAAMIERSDEDLDEKLLDASMPLIELENFEDVEDENSSVFIAYSDEDLDDFEAEFNATTNHIKTIYVAEDVCMSESQERLFELSEIKVKTIPSNYFREM